MKYKLLLALLLIPCVVAAKPKVSTLPPWFADALADTSLYVGIAPPCDNIAAAQDMAIATAVLNWMFNTGNYTAEMKGNYNMRSVGACDTLAWWFEEIITAKKPIEVHLRNSFINNNNECFVMCKITEGSVGRPPVLKRSMYEVSDSVYENVSTFEMKTKVLNTASPSGFSDLRNISGVFARTFGKAEKSEMLKVNDVEFQLGQSFKYPDVTCFVPSKAEFPIVKNLGLAFYELLIAFPPALWNMEARGTAALDGFMSINKMQVRFESSGQPRPDDLRIRGLGGSSLYYTLSQQVLLYKIARDKIEPDRPPYYFSAFNPDDSFGFDHALMMAYFDAIGLWAIEKGSRINGHLVFDNPDNESEWRTFESFFEVNGSGGDFNVLWTLDGSPSSPDYVGGLTIVEIDNKEERLAQFHEALRAQAHTIPQDPPATQVQTAPAPAQVKFKFRTPDNSKFSEPEFKLTFTTNAKRATYHISGSSESHTISEADLRAGVHNVALPLHDCDLTLADESGQIHVLHFVYDQALGLRKSATLHILSIGVNDYPADNLENLRYAEADAQAVVDAIASRHKYTFANIEKTLLLGDAVTPERIGAEIEKIADNADYNDLAIIFFAGHGLVDSRNYYLATSKVIDKDVPRKGGFSASTFAEKIGYINCKLVVFVDACYSGKMLDSFRAGSVNNGEFFREITSTPNGTNIYTSSGADVRSKESDAFGHGVFTQALIEACDFNNSDADGDGRITITEIRNYLERRITEITNKQQRPVYRNLEEIDYPLFIR